MERKKSNEQFSDTSSTRESEKIYPFCISLVSSLLKELENEWVNKLNDIGMSNNNIIQLLFSLLNYQILLIQQISKYYNIYLYNSDEDNIRFIDQIVEINKELINKKIKRIINISLNIVSNEKNNNINPNNNKNINEEKMLNYKITKLHNETNNKIINEQIQINCNSNSNRDYSYKDIGKKTYKNFGYNEKKNKIVKIKDIKKKEENKNCSTLSNITIEKNINKLNLNDMIINTQSKNFNRRNELLKRNNTEKSDILYVSPYQKKKNLESSQNNNNGKIKINLNDKFVKNNNNENNEFATLSNISRHHSKNTLQNNQCLAQTIANFHKKQNIYTLSVEENPVRKVKNIILNAKNPSSFFLKLENSPSNNDILNKERYTAYSTNRNYILSEEANKEFHKGLSNKIKKHKIKISCFNNSSNIIHKTNNNLEIKKSMSDKNFLSIKNINNINKKSIKVQNKERKCNQILKDGMKKIEKRLSSKDGKKNLYKTKSNECLSLIKRMIKKANNKKNINK